MKRALLGLIVLVAGAVLARSLIPAEFNWDVAWLLHVAERVLDGANGPATMDLAANDVREALELMGEATGNALPESATEGGGVSEDILDRIFSTFCIGK